MLLDIFLAIAMSAAFVVFFVFYLAFAYLLFSPLMDYLIEGWKSSSRSASALGMCVPDTCMAED
jgi:hypothetical protein